MPFEKISERKSISVENGLPGAQLIAFLSKYRGAIVEISGGDLAVNYQRDETPAEKAVRVTQKVAPIIIPEPIKIPEPVSNKKRKGRK